MDRYWVSTILRYPGLPDPGPSETVECIMIESLTKLNPETEITPPDIDICHILPS